jgi:hypothetical protein
MTFRDLVAEFMSHRQTSKLEQYPLLVVRNCILNAVSATLPIWRSLAVVVGNSMQNLCLHNPK